jgi:outer membrane immunogenic protein
VSADERHLGINMTKSLRMFLLTGVSSVALATAASAADMGPPVKAPVPTPIAVYNWAGFYIGVNGGIARQNYSIAANDEGSTVSGSGTGGIVGGQIGYNWQQRYWVYGVEVDEDWANLSNNQITGESGFQAATTSKVESLGSARLRTGLAIEDTLVYVTGGVAWGHVKNGWGAGYTVPEGVCCDVFSSQTRVGWVTGVGVEHMFDQHWSARLEGLYYDLGRNTVNATIDGETYSSQFTNEVFTARLGVNYKW